MDWHAIFNAIDSPAMILDLQQRILEVNEKTIEITGLSAEELIGRHCYEVFHGQQRPPQNCPFQALISTKKPQSATMAIEVFGKVYMVFISPLFDDNGEIEKILHIARDVTEQHRAKEALRKSEEKFRTVADFTFDWEYWTDPDNKFIYVSPSAERITGYTTKEFHDDPGLMLRIIHPDDRNGFINYQHRQLDGGKVSPLRFRLITKSGEERWISHVCRQVYAEDRKFLGIRSSNRDITEQKKAETAKVTLQAKLMQARKMEAIATLAGGVAHDFNNALTVVIGNIELLKINPSSHNIESCVQTLEKAALRMTDLTKQLLAYARGGRYEIKKINLQQFIKQTIQEVRCGVDRNFEVVSNLDCRESLIMTDSNQLRMLFNAITTNAIEAVTDQGRIEISCSEQKLTEEFIRSHPGSEYGSYVCFSVKDNGCGMDEETLGKIFEPFYSTKFAGRGLGMAAVYGIVKNNGGYISVDSKPGKGTLVEVYLPLFLPGPAAIAKTAEPAEKLTILLIEDEETLHVVEKRLLETLGYDVLTVKNGREALHLLKDYHGTIDLVMMDVHLPDITADILYLKLIEARPVMKVLICSGSALEWTAQKALNAGAEGFIEKPFSLQKLNEALLKVIHMH